MEELHYLIRGDARTKKNHMQIVGSGARCPVCGKPKKQWIRQGEAHDAFTAAAAWQIRPIPEKPIDYPVNCKYVFYMKTHRLVDGLNLQATIDDLLVEAGVLKDDNVRIVAGHDGSRVRYDKDNPRVEITITKMEENEI